MYPEDRVLVGVMPDPRDITTAREQHWYRIPQRSATHGIFAEYVAFYFTKQFPDDLRWAIHYYARRTGHELVRRTDLFPDEPDHPRAQELYYKLQLGPLRQKQPPIVSIRWRRITFIQTTWDRFTAAREINDLYRSDHAYVDRMYTRLKQDGILPDRAVLVQEGKKQFLVDLVIHCNNGKLMFSADSNRPSRALALTGNDEIDMALITIAIEKLGGAVMADIPL